MSNQEETGPNAKNSLARYVMRITDRLCAGVRSKPQSEFRRYQLKDTKRGKCELPDHADHALPHGRLWSAAHWFAQSQGCGRVGDQTDDRMGIRERPPRSVGLRTS